LRVKVFILHSYPNLVLIFLEFLNKLYIVFLLNVRWDKSINNGGKCYTVNYLAFPMYFRVSYSNIS